MLQYLAIRNTAVYCTLECYMHGSSSFPESTAVHKIFKCFRRGTL